MISKERLEELIKEEKGCYILANAYTIGYIHLNKKYEPKIEPTKDGYCLWVFTSNEFDFRDPINDYNLFETKEDARWELEMTATRTETLKLPNFEEFMLNYKGVYKFNTPSGKIVKINGYYDEGLKIPCGFIDICVSGSCIKDWDFSKENYIEVCRLAKKLFLGEEV